MPSTGAIFEPAKIGVEVVQAKAFRCLLFQTLARSATRTLLGTAADVTMTWTKTMNTTNTLVMKTMTMNTMTMNTLVMKTMMMKKTVTMKTMMMETMKTYNLW